MQTIRRYYILIKMDKDDAIMWDERVARVINGLEKQGSLTQSYNQIFIHGVCVLEENNKADGSENIEGAAIGARLREVEHEKARNKKLEELYAAMGLSEFVDWCAENDIDWELFLENYNLTKQGQVKWSEKATIWLRHFLTERKHTTEIRERAIVEGLINGDDKDWSKLRTVASREGFTTDEKSHWQYTG